MSSNLELLAQVGLVKTPTSAIESMTDSELFAHVFDLIDERDKGIAARDPKNARKGAGTRADVTRTLGTAVDELVNGRGFAIATVKDAIATREVPAEVIESESEGTDSEGDSDATDES